MNADEMLKKIGYESGNHSIYIKYYTEDELIDIPDADTYGKPRKEIYFYPNEVLISNTINTFRRVGTDSNVLSYEEIRAITKKIDELEYESENREMGIE